MACLNELDKMAEKWTTLIFHEVWKEIYSITNGGIYKQCKDPVKPCRHFKNDAEYNSGGKLNLNTDTVIDLVGSKTSNVLQCDINGFYDTRNEISHSNMSDGNHQLEMFAVKLSAEVVYSAINKMVCCINECYDHSYNVYDTNFSKDLSSLARDLSTDKCFQLNVKPLKDGKNLVPLIFPTVVDQLLENPYIDDSFTLQNSACSTTSSIITYSEAKRNIAAYKYGFSINIDDVVSSETSSACSLETVQENSEEYDACCDISLCDTFFCDLIKHQNWNITNQASSVKHKKPGKPKKLARMEKKKRKILRNLIQEVPGYDEMEFLTSENMYGTRHVEELYDHNLCCPVCLEVYYNPYECVPCKHSFCEPCLRRLAKCNLDNKREHQCPICREIISHCQRNAELRELVESTLPNEYDQRRLTDGSSKYMCQPLPSKPTKVSLKNIADRIRERNRARERQENPTRNFFASIMTVEFWKLVLFFLVKGVAITGLVWLCNLLSNDGKLHAYLEYYRKHLWNYHELDEASQARVTNEVVVCILLLSVFIVMSSYVIKRLNAQRRR